MAFKVSVAAGVRTGTGSVFMFNSHVEMELTTGNENKSEDGGAVVLGQTAGGNTEQTGHDTDTSTLTASSTLFQLVSNMFGFFMPILTLILMSLRPPSLL